MICNGGSTGKHQAMYVSTESSRTLTASSTSSRAEGFLIGMIRIFQGSWEPDKQFPQNISQRQVGYLDHGLHHDLDNHP